MTTPQTGRMPGFEVPATLAVKRGIQPGRVEERREAVCLRSLDRRCALTIGVAAVGAVGYTVGSWMRAWEPAVPDGLLWTLIVAVSAVAGAVGLTALWRCWRCWRDWWPYRHNRILAAVAEIEDGRSAGGAR